MQVIINQLMALGLELPPAKRQGSVQEIKFLEVWCFKGAASIPPGTLQQIEARKAPESPKELQQFLGTLEYWRKHIHRLSIIARPLYNLLWKGKKWEWTDIHEQALQTLITELRAFQQIGPIHTTDLIHVEWGFSEHESHCNLWQKGPSGPIRPLGFTSQSFNDTESRYTDMERGLLSLVRALKQAEQIHADQEIIIRGPFRLLDMVRNGITPPEGIAQNPTVRKWHAYLEGIGNLINITEGSTKVSKLQKDVDPTLVYKAQPKLSPIKEAPPITEGSNLTGV